MTLISLLLVMALERITSKNPNWHIHKLVGRYQAWLVKRRYVKTQQSLLTVVLLALLPAAFAYLLIFLADNLFFTFALQLLILWVCLGCPVTRKSYKRYLQAANKQDYEACALHSISFGNADGDLNKVAEQLIFINYRQYAAIVLWFVALGVPGVVFYSILKEWQIYSAVKPSSTDNSFVPDVLADNETSISDFQQTIDSSPVDRVMHIIDWLPVRITGLGFLIVGHFSRAMAVWLPSWFDTSTHAKSILNQISIAAEDIDATSANDECIERPCTMVKLAKRNVTFLLVVVSILTMVGAVS